MVYGFFALLFVEAIILCRLSRDSEGDGELALGAAMGFFAVLFASATIDIVYGIIWFVIKHNH